MCDLYSSPTKLENHDKWCIINKLCPVLRAMAADTVDEKEREGSNHRNRAYTNKSGSTSEVFKRASPSNKEIRHLMTLSLRVRKVFRSHSVLFSGQIDARLRFLTWSAVHPWTISYQLSRAILRGCFPSSCNLVEIPIYMSHRLLAIFIIDPCVLVPAAGTSAFSTARAGLTSLIETALRGCTHDVCGELEAVSSQIQLFCSQISHRIQNTSTPDNDNGELKIIAKATPILRLISRARLTEKSWIFFFLISQDIERIL